MSVRVYYEDTDFSGVVYHANYLRYLERGRTEMLRDLGVTQSALHGAADGPGAFAVRAMTIDFKAPARMDDMLAVETGVEALGGASVTLRQTITRSDTVLVQAVVRIAFVGAGRAQRLPADIARRLNSVRREQSGL